MGTPPFREWVTLFFKRLTRVRNISQFTRTDRASVLPGIPWIGRVWGSLGLRQGAEPGVCDGAGTVVLPAGAGAGARAVAGAEAGVRFAGSTGGGGRVGGWGLAGCKKVGTDYNTGQLSVKLLSIKMSDKHEENKIE